MTALLSLPEVSPLSSAVRARTERERDLVVGAAHP